MEWFSNFYAATQMSDDPLERPLEGICREGEIMFVPRGWWHAVVNLDDCIAVTQNYVGSQNLKETMQFLYFKRDQVSGVSDDRREGLFEEFKEAFFKSNWTPPADTTSNEKNDTVALTDQEDQPLTAAELEKRKQLMALWIENEEEIERISRSVKRCKGDTSDENGGPEVLSFWEQAKLGTAGSETTGDDGSTETEKAAPGIGGGFSFGFDFGDEDDEGEEEEGQGEDAQETDDTIAQQQQ